MRVLLDENLPHDLIAELTGHDVVTVQGVGLEREHDLTVLPFGVIVLMARSNRVQHLLPLVARILEALQRIKPGLVEHASA